MAKQTNAIIKTAEAHAVSILDHLALGNEVLDMRRRGMSYVRIAQEINKNRKDVLDGTHITNTMIANYCNRHKTEENRAERAGEVINVYAEQGKLLDLVEKQIQIIQIFLDDLHKQVDNGNTTDSVYKKMKDMMSDLEKYTARKQSILTQMQALQEKVYNIQVLSDINQRILTILEETDPKVYQDVVNKMKVDPMLLMAYQKARNLEN